MVWRVEVGGELPAKLKSSSKKLSGTRPTDATVVVVHTATVQATRLFSGAALLEESPRRGVRVGHQPQGPWTSEAGD